MNTLITALMIGVFTGGCASVPVATAMDYEPAFSGLGYMGPTAVTVVLDDGTIAETLEVAAARAAHLAAHLAALEISRGTNPGMDDGHYDPHKYGDNFYRINSHYEDLTKGIATYNPLAQDHHVSGIAATNAVGKAQETAHSQAKASAEAEAALALWKAKNTAAGGYASGVPADENKPYFRPLAMLQVLPTGYLADTEEVAAAKKIHLSAWAEAKAAEAAWKTKYVQTQHHPWN